LLEKEQENVKLVLFVKFKGALLLNVTVDDENTMLLRLVILELSSEAVKLYPAVSNVPWLTVIVPEDVSASPSVTVIPDPLIVSGPIVFPAVVSVDVALIVNVPL
jgi:hypothetical protein